MPIEAVPTILETGIETAVRTATGWPGLGLIFAYSFLIAFVLPLPSEVVLPAYTTLAIGLPDPAVLAIIIVVSAAGKAAGSVFAFHIGQHAKQSGPVIKLLRKSRFNIVEWSERRAVEIAREYGFAGLAAALCVPGFPDTLSIYAFAVLEEDYFRFAAATFAGSAGRLLVTMGAVGAVASIF